MPGIPSRVVLALTVAGLMACSSSSPTTSRSHGSSAAPDTPVSVSGLTRSEVVLAALGHIDAPYRYGGTDGRGLDCSALVQRAYREAGVHHVPRTTSGQARAARLIPVAQAQPGDVLFFAVNGNRINHVGVFIGDGRFVHAPNSRSEVRIEPLASSFWKPRLRKAGHFFE